MISLQHIKVYNNLESASSLSSSLSLPPTS